MSELRNISESGIQEQELSSSSTSSSEIPLTSGVEARMKELIIRDKIIKSLRQDIDNEVILRMGVNDTYITENNNGNNNSKAKINISHYEAMIETYCFVIETKPYIE
jgi:hypothetical protein